jgi:5'-nucleotidase/UDP-sugar diphosphatase
MEFQIPELRNYKFTAGNPAFVLLLFYFFLSIPQGSLPAADTELTIIYSNNTNGLLENCQCPEHAYGALEKRAAVIDSLRRSHKNVLLLESGDLLDIRKNSLLHSYVVQAYEIMNYDAWTCGDQDFMEGVDFFNSLIHNSRFPPLLSTNIRQVQMPGNGAVGQKYLIKKYGQLRIGITGTINPDFHNYLEKESLAKFIFTEQKPALQAVLTELKPQCDFIVLISHSGYEQDKNLAEWFPLVNLIIGGHSQTLIADTQLTGKTCIVQCGENGYRLGILTLRFSDQQLVSQENKLILLDAAIRNFPAVMELVTSYHQQLAKKKH